MQVQLTYDRHTQVTTTWNSSAIDFAANLRRQPVTFRGEVRDPFLMRQMMIAVQDVILGNYTWQGQMWTLDPVITVHPDEVFFEAFSQDESAYVRLSASHEAFTLIGEMIYGTTNIDFTFGLREAMLNMRSSRRTEFTVGAGGFGLQTETHGETQAHFEQKVDVPNSWIKGFLQVQAALTMKPFTFDVRPADLTTAIAYLLEHKARRPPRGLRYSFVPGQEITVKLEPWGDVIPLHGTAYEGYERTVRVWGRKRLEMLLGVLPYADKVTIGVLGRGLPHFYICHCGAYRFMLLLSGWVENDWSKGSSLDLLVKGTADAEQVATVYNFLVQHLSARPSEIGAYTLLETPAIEAALTHLCKAGRVIYDPTTRRYRLRELFAEPINLSEIFVPDPRTARAQTLKVEVHSVGMSDTRQHEIKATAEVEDGAERYQTLITVDRDYRIRFGQCQCAFFQEHILSRGPCEHMLAVYQNIEQMLHFPENSDTIGVS